MQVDLSGMSSSGDEEDQHSVNSEGDEDEVLSASVPHLARPQRLREFRPDTSDDDVEVEDESPRSSLAEVEEGGEEEGELLARDVFGCPLSSAECAMREGWPKELNTKTLSHSCVVGCDKLTAKYVGKGRHAHDVGAVRADHPCPTDVPVYYFEMKLVDVSPGKEFGVCSIGLTSTSFGKSRHPGWDKDTYAYHGDDGRKFGNGKKGVPYASRMSAGDIVGCGVNYEAREIFFTKNGEYLGPAFSVILNPFYPTFALHSPDEKIAVNFGQFPFHFDIEQFAAGLKQKEEGEIDAVVLPSRLTIDDLLLDYFLHSGYKRTFEAFQSHTDKLDSQEIKKEDVKGKRGAADSIALRSRMRQMICSGEAMAVLNELQASYPHYLHNADCAITLACQCFIEMVGKGNVMEAIQFSRAHLSSEKVVGGSPAAKKLVKDVLALLPYEDPSLSPLAHLLTHQQRQKTAQIVNDCILSVTSGEKYSKLEQVLRQLEVAQMEYRRVKKDNTGAVYKVEEELVRNCVDSGEEQGWMDSATPLTSTIATASDQRGAGREGVTKEKHQTATKEESMDTE